MQLASAAAHVVGWSASSSCWGVVAERYLCDPDVPRRAVARRLLALRADLGRAILLGLEFLVIADIIGTVAVEPATLQSRRPGGHRRDRTC
ncbi:MAG: DUF1622 domain-containing protein [Reyranellaceae bacterium]